MKMVWKLPSDASWAAISTVHADSSEAREDSVDWFESVKCYGAPGDEASDVYEPGQGAYCLVDDDCNLITSLDKFEKDYILISAIGILFIFGYNGICAILRGLGDSFSALVYLLVATVINIVLDIYFVAKLGLGVPGVALATVIAQFISSILCVLKLAKMKEFFDFFYKFAKKYNIIKEKL